LNHGAVTGADTVVRRAVPRSAATSKKSKNGTLSGLLATVNELPTATVLAVAVALLCVIGLVMVGLRLFGDIHLRLRQSMGHPH